jgi:hypothetical protein
MLAIITAEIPQTLKSSLASQFSEFATVEEEGSVHSLK